MIFITSFPTVCTHIFFDMSWSQRQCLDFIAQTDSGVDSTTIPLGGKVRWENVKPPAAGEQRERQRERDSTSGACPPHLWPSGHMTTHTWIARGRLPIKVLQTWICGRRWGHAPWQQGSLTLSVISTTRCRAITCSLSSRLLPFKSFSTRCRLGENRDEKRENGREVFFSHPPPSER